MNIERPLRKRAPSSDNVIGYLQRHGYSESLHTKMFLKKYLATKKLW